MHRDTDGKEPKKKDFGGLGGVDLFQKPGFKDASGGNGLESQKRGGFWLLTRFVLLFPCLVLC